MATVDKVKIGSTTYDVAPSGAGTLNTDSTHGTVYTSNDSSTATSWTSVDVISTSNTQATIFSKLTSMVKNIRFLYNKLGTSDFSAVGSTVSAALVSLNNNKAATSHTHAASALPTSDTQVNSSSYIPTSSLVYSMNTKLTTLYDAKTQYGTTDIGEGSSLNTGAIYCVYQN